jgi:hypothetical protein
MYKSALISIKYEKLDQRGRARSINTGQPVRSPRGHQTGYGTQAKKPGLDGITI